MAKTSGELETEFIQTAKNLTGKSLPEWLKTVKVSGLEKRNDILEWLKKGHGLNHMQAQFVAGIFLNNGNPVYGNEQNLLENQFARDNNLRPLFEEIHKRIIKGFQGVQLIPKKTYLSFTGIREFVALNIKTGEIRIGLDLGEERFTGLLQKAKLSGPMPRFSHMIVIYELAQFDNDVMTLIRKSYERTHQK